MISKIKDQIGKDIGRDDRSINGKMYEGTRYLDLKDNNSRADLFLTDIIKYLYKVNKLINLNVLNKIGILSCQNIYGLITDIITVQLKKISKARDNSVFKADKNASITINSSQISIEFNFKSELIISRDEEFMDPEYPCGNLEFVLFIDILHKSYKLKKFILSYDIDKCGPENPNQTINSDLANRENNKTNFLTPQYAIPAALVTAGIVATPFLLTTLGGKKTKKKKNSYYKTKYIKQV
jgi:hypothetical protein